MKNKIKNIVLVMLVAVVSGSLSSILTTNGLSGNKLLGSVSYSDYLDSSNVTYSDSNVQDSIDNLYTKANDYSKLSSIIGTDEEKTAFVNTDGSTKTLIGSVLNIGDITSTTSPSTHSEIAPNEYTEIATLTLKEPGTYIIFAYHEWEKSCDAIYVDYISGIGRVRNSMYAGGGSITSGVITTIYENYVVSYKTVQTYSSSVNAKSISLNAIRIK